MDAAMRKKSLMRKSLTQFAVCVAVLLLLATPLFYWLTKSFYAEDMIDIIEAVRNGRQIPPLDLEADIMQGIMIQFGLIAAVFGAAIVLMMRLISKRLWLPFDRTLAAVEAFRLEDGVCPQFEESDVEEFSRLNAVLDRMIAGSLHSYRVQKEFTENASHELQTPLAVFRSRLDVLLQQPGMTEEQAAIIQDLYRMNGRLSRLTRNLLLLAKMDNRQFGMEEHVDVVALLDDLMPYLESIAGGLTVIRDTAAGHFSGRANRSLLESLISNLVVNAVRHNHKGGEIVLTTTPGTLTVANTSDEPALDGERMFSRFWQSGSGTHGNGLGLAIVKAVCRYHGWDVEYAYCDGVHEFKVNLFKSEKVKR